MKENIKMQAVSDLLLEQLHTNNNAVLTVISASMKPMIQIGDKVVVQSISTKDMIAGDIILFNKGETFCTHRFICIQKFEDQLKLIMKGDRLKNFDLPIAENQVMGKVVKIIHDEKCFDLTTKRCYIFSRLFVFLLKTQWIVQHELITSMKRFHENFNRILAKIIYHLCHPFNQFISYLITKINQWQTHENI